jgi:CRISPR-associated protein Csy3
MPAEVKNADKARLKADLLAFARSIQVSEGLISAVRESAGSEIVVPVVVVEKTVRGQISNAPKKGKEFHFDKPNPQTVDYAMMPPGFDRLRIEFTTIILPNALKPHASDDLRVAQAYEDLISTYAERRGFEYLAERYLWNFANARWVWRNRYSALDGRVTLELGDRRVVFNPHLLSLDAYPGLKELGAALEEGTETDLKNFVEATAEGLSRRDASVPVLRTRFDARVAPHSEVFPSQEFVNEEARRDVGRILSAVRVEHAGGMVRQATLHSQKIGAALRFIDEWHGNADFGAVSVNPYAGVTELSVALRGPNKNSFYDLLDKPDHLFRLAQTADHKNPEAGDLHFFVANLVRGGVYGVKED